MGIKSYLKHRKEMKGIKKEYKGFVLSGFDSSAEVNWASNENYAKLAKHTYCANVVAYRSITMVAESVGSVPFKLYKKLQDDQRELVENHPMNDVLLRPNPTDSWNFLIKKLMSYQLISGNAYLRGITPDNGANSGVIKELETIRPDKISAVINDSGKQTGWKIKDSGKEEIIEIDPVTGQSDILHLKLFHPTNDVYGLSPAVPGAIDINTNNSGGIWNMNLLKNSARPGMALAINGFLTEPQYERLKSELSDKFEGASNAGKTFILESAAGSGAPSKIEAFGWNPKDLDFHEGTRETARKIALLYGVPPQLLGIPGDSTYSNYQEARLAFWEDTILPMVSYLTNELNNWLFEKEDDLFLDGVLDHIAALAPRRDKLWERAEKATFLSINEKREMVGLEKVDSGDVILVTSSLVPLETAAEPLVLPEDDPDNDENDDTETEEDIDEEEDKQLLHLMNEGYSREDAELILSLNLGDAGA